MLNKRLDNIGAVILAAGKGTRLQCLDKPKVMLPIGGRPIVDYTVETLERVGLSDEQICLVVGFLKEIVTDHFGDRVSYAFQEEQWGTAHAAFVGIQQLPEHIEHVLVAGGDDSAFYSPETLADFIDRHQKSDTVLSLLTVEVENPNQLGRIVRHPDGKIEIIEKEYLTEEQKRIKEISTGTFCFNRQWFEQMFPNMPPLRKLGEFGLPTALALAREKGLPYQVVKLGKPEEWFGVNTPEELAEADKRKRLKV